VALHLAGLIPATVLPMHADGTPDEPALRSYLRWISAQGPVGLAVNADTGEGPSLTHREKVRVVEVAREEVELPLIAGLGSCDGLTEAGDFRAAGADALLVFPATGDAAERHRVLSDADVPLIAFQLQPALGGVLYDAPALRRILAVDGVVALKEASFDRSRYVEALRLADEAGVVGLSGNDNFICESFVLGAKGALVGFGAMMTAEQVAMIRAWRGERTEEAFALGARIQDVADAVFAPPVSDYRARLKECLVQLGVLPAGHVRSPLRPLPAGEKERLGKVLAGAGLLP
jgi:4-hydroxy-tetrahydrodipicolinate synthase